MNDASTQPDATTIAAIAKKAHYDVAAKLNQKGDTLVNNAKQLQADMEQYIKDIGSSLRAEAENAIEAALTGQQALRAAADIAMKQGDDLLDQVIASVTASKQAAAMAESIGKHYGNATVQD